MPNWMTWVGISFTSLLMIEEVLKAMLPNQRFPFGPIILIILGLSAIVGGSAWWNDITKSSKFINFLIRANIDDYPPDAQLAEIKWNPSYTDIRVAINNPTNRDYNNLEINITTDMKIAAISQITKLPNVLFMPVDIPVVDLSIKVTNQTTGKTKTYPLPLTAMPNIKVFSPQYSVRCAILPSRSHIDLILAAVRIDETSITKPQGIVFEEKSLPKWVKVNIRYQDSGHEHTLEEKKDF